uniref:Uncharacterized protein n=1 Tax=Lepeophtheirus salmonis TaxID=72036 RepID=A0A0K2TRX4_LEPSM
MSFDKSLTPGSSSMKIFNFKIRAHFFPFFENHFGRESLFVFFLLENPFTELLFKMRPLGRTLSEIALGFR